jgi:pimeloyl-ACP methyl ester carboxylesterase
VPFGGALRRAGRRDGLAVWLLRYRYRGWNEPDRDPVSDARWALQRVRESHPAVPVVLLGHSMGARVGLYVADDPAVVAVCALAPWIEHGDPVAQLRGKSLLIAHGDLERVTSPAVSVDYAQDARQVSDRVCRFDVHGDGHAMLRRARDWTRLVRRFVLAELGMRPMDQQIAAAMAAPAERGLRVPL